MECCGSAWVSNASDASEYQTLTSLGISLFFAVRGIATDLRQVVDLTEIKHAEREDKIISEGTEDGTPTLQIPCTYHLTLCQCLSWIPF